QHAVAGDQRAAAPRERSKGQAGPSRPHRRQETMSRTLLLSLAAGALVGAAAPGCAQSLAGRVDNAPDGRVQFTYAARPGVCGNGRTFIQTGPNSYYGNFNGSFYGNYSSDGTRMDPCVPGPVRVLIDRADKLPLSIQVFVGPPDSITRGTTDLGRVRAQDAADYLLSIAAKSDGRAGRDAIF